MKYIIFRNKTVAVFISLIALIGSCKSKFTSDEVQPNIPTPTITVWSSNCHTYTAGVARACPDGMGGAYSTVTYTVNLSSMNDESYIFDSLWIAQPPVSDTLPYYFTSDTIIAYNLRNASAQSFGLNQVQEDGNTYALRATYTKDPCRGLQLDNNVRKIKLPITPDVIASGIVSYYSKNNSYRRYIIIKNMTKTSLMGM